MAVNVGNITKKITDKFSNYQIYTVVLFDFIASKHLPVKIPAIADLYSALAHSSELSDEVFRAASINPSDPFPSITSKGI
jgi:hypothetical protein